MSAVFDRAFAAVIGVEGGYARNPTDPGGETKYGISKRSYPTLDIANLTLDDAKAIYKRDYWDRIAGDQLPPPVALLCFDEAVNSGVQQAAKWLQTAAGTAADGVIGPATLAAVRARSVASILIEMTARRTVMLAGLPTWSTFGLGWARRLPTILLAAAALDDVPAAPDIAAVIKQAMREVIAEGRAQ